MSTTALLWLRRDLRLHDNPALRHAVNEHRRVIPVYIHAPEEESPWQPGAASRWWLQQSLTALDQALRRNNSKLILRTGPSLTALQQLIQETGAVAVYWNRLYEPATIGRDKTIKPALRNSGIRAESFNAALLWEPWTITSKSGDPYKVFTPYWKNSIRTLPATPVPAPVALPAPVAWPASLAPDELELMPGIAWYETMAQTWQPGEAGALARLEHFCATALDGYADSRNIPADEGVSGLSPHLHFGEISPRQVWQAVAHEKHGEPLQYKSSENYLRELGWREFAHYVLYHWPHTAESPMQERFIHYPWRENYGDLLTAWQKGQTGIPLVDAGMRQLWQTGWMHNRVRMIVASFLTKNLRIPWQEGARWFWDTLVDADLAGNTMGWQWTAGCGTDAAPYFRIFNPIRQSEQFDPNGDYIRRWVPELSKLDKRGIHKPWEKTLPAQGYAKPIIDLAASRAQALAGFDRIKQIRIG